MSLKIIFAGTPEFAVAPLRALLNSHHSVIAVYTQPDRPAGRGRQVLPSAVKQLALECSIPIFQPTTLKDPLEQTIFNQLQADILIVVAYGLILPKAILESPKYGGVNIHASLLPRWRGAAPIQRAILAGDLTTGVSIMQMDEGLDTGDVLSMQSCPIGLEDTSEALHTKLSSMGTAALMDILEKLEQNKVHPVKQDLVGISYAPKITKAEAKIDWRESAEVIERKVRGFNPWPVAFTFLEQDLQPIRIWSALALAHKATAPFGTILAVNEAGIEVATSTGILRILELQMPGSKRLTVKEILNSKGSSFFAGKTLR